MGIPLGTFIANLKKVRSEGLCRITEKQIKDLFYTVLRQVAEYTIIDTGQARSAIIEIFANKYSYNVSYLWTPYLEDDVWGNARFRGIGEADVSYKDGFNKRDGYVGLSIDDEGLFAQEHATEVDGYNGHQYPSEKHSEKTGRDNSKFELRHITKVGDEYLNYPEVQKLIEQMVNEIENKIIKG